jgi:hypothetical protein
MSRCFGVQGIDRCVDDAAIELLFADRLLESRKPAIALAFQFPHASAGARKIGPRGAAALGQLIHAMGSGAAPSKAP